MIFSSIRVRAGLFVRMWFLLGAEIFSRPELYLLFTLEARVTRRYRFGLRIIYAINLAKRNEIRKYTV